MGLVDAEVGDAFVNSLKLAAGTALFGTVARLRRRLHAREDARPRTRCGRWCACWRCCRWRCPGLVLGLGYIFFFNAPGNPLNGLYQTLTLLVALHHRPLLHHRPPDRGDGAEGARRRVRGGVSASLKVPFFKTFWRVTLPICTPALVDIARYFFINAMTTISAVVFLYSPDTKVAAIAILTSTRPARPAPRRRCAVLITAASTVVTLLFMALGALDRPAHAGLARSAAADPTARRRIGDYRMDRDAILLTPGPLTTTVRTKLRDAARLGLVGRRLQSPSPPSCASSCSTIVHGEDIARRRAAAGQRHLLGRGGGGDARAARRPRAGARQRRLLQAAAASCRR